MKTTVGCLDHRCLTCDPQREKKNQRDALEEVLQRTKSRDVGRSVVDYVGQLVFLVSWLGCPVGNLLELVDRGYKCSSLSRLAQ